MSFDRVREERSLLLAPSGGAPRLLVGLLVGGSSMSAFYNLRPLWGATRHCELRRTPFSRRWVNKS